LRNWSANDVNMCVAAKMFCFSLQRNSLNLCEKETEQSGFLLVGWTFCIKIWNFTNASDNFF